MAGRRKALARAVALAIVHAEGRMWSRLDDAERARREREALELVDAWVRADVLASFEHEWRER